MERETQYIQITKPSFKTLWYKELTGKIYPVLQKEEGKIYVAGHGTNNYDDAFFIHESDCIPVSITLNTEQKKMNKFDHIACREDFPYPIPKDKTTMADIKQVKVETKEEIKGELTDALIEEINYCLIQSQEFYTAANFRLYVESQKKLAQVVEPKHQASEQQIAELAKAAVMNNLTKEERYNFIKSVFPNAEVFKPKQTYSLKGRFRVGDRIETLARYGSKLLAIDEKNHSVVSEIYCDIKSQITEEDLKKLFSPEPYKLIE